MVDTAIINPIESAYGLSNKYTFVHFFGVTDPIFARLEYEYATLCKDLRLNGQAFDYIDEGLFAKYGSVNKDEFICGLRKYKKIIVNANYNMRSTTLSAIKDFIANGGKGKVTTQIIMLRDYSIAENNNAGADHSYSNMSHYGHTLLIDLGGHKMTMNSGTDTDDFEMLNLVSRTMSSTVPPANNTIVVKNGELVPEGAPIVTNSVQNTDARKANYTHAVRYSVLFKDVQFTVPAESAFPIVVTAKTVTNDNDHGGDHDIRFEDCVFDLSAVSSAYTMFTGADN